MSGNDQSARLRSLLITM